MRPQRITLQIILVLLAILLFFAIVLGQSSAPVGTSSQPNNVSLSSPARIAFLAKGQLLVSDYGASSICVVDRADLSVLRCFTVAGRPLGTAWSQGRIYVGNEDAQRVELYTVTGKLIAASPENVAAPSDIAIDERIGRVFVVDTGDRNIKVMDLDGRLLYTITGNGSTDSVLVHPVAIAVDPVRGELLVSDYGDPAFRHRAAIRIFDYAGNFVAVISGRTGGFSRPQGLAVADGRIYLADGLLGEVLVFDQASGARVGAFGSFGDGPGELMLPLDVVIDAGSRNVYVTNNRNGRIERFEMGGLLP